MFGAGRGSAEFVDVGGESGADAGGESFVAFYVGGDVGDGGGLRESLGERGESGFDFGCCAPRFIDCGAFGEVGKIADVGSELPGDFFVAESFDGSKTRVSVDKQHRDTFSEGTGISRVIATREGDVHSAFGE